MKKFAQTGVAILLLIAVGGASCELNLRQDDEGLTADEVDTAELQKAGVTTAQNLFSDFLEMVEEAEEMNQAEIDNMSDQDVLQLGKPLQEVTASTTYFTHETLQQLSGPFRTLTENFSSLTENEHTRVSNRVEKILDSGMDSADGPRTKNAGEIREILKSWGSDSDSTSACGDLFNQLENFILIGEGEQFNIANYSCPDGSNFIIQGGIHSGQSVLRSKNGNSWIGLTGAVMDGEDSIYRAFSGGMNRNSIGWIELRNYHLHGIYSRKGTSDVLIRKVTFSNIAPDSSGQYFGAIQFDHSTKVTVSESNFENVASGIRLRFSKGPLEIINNHARNTGRNFFQCDDCNGGGIRITANSLVRSDAYGADTLEDWINLYKSSGDSTDWIRVNHNRARGHSLSGSGSFIMLGDAGGMYQEAVGNIGVNPGQVGIGIAGGHDIKVEANQMYSVAWDSSNVAFYSARYSENCGNHIFPGFGSSTPNRANWICGDPVHCNPPAMNHAWTDGQCGITNGEIRNNVLIDRSMDADVWDEW